jgi:hypothetical protein
MAQRIETVFIDDLDGSEADTTVRFGLGGAEYEIDLSASHADELRAVMEPYIAAGRRLRAPARRALRGSVRGSAASGPRPSEVREWAKSQGIEVKDRGRVPDELVVKFQAAAGG